MGAYIVRYDRENCIGAAACTVVQPDRWVIVEDGKADFTGGTLNEASGLFELEIDDSELENFKKAADVCPVSVINIFDKETGKKIYPET